MSNRLRRSAVAVSAASALCLVAALSGSASAAGSKGIKGEPQPELKPFTIGSAGGSGTVAIESNGDLVVVYENHPETDVHVCVIARAGHSCTFTNTLHPLSGDGLSGTPQVFAPAPDEVVVLMGAGAVHGNLLFTSTDSGRTFAGVVVGDEIAPSSAALVGNQIAYTDEDDSNGVVVAAVSIASPAVPGTIANPSSHGGATGIASYHGGVLVGGDDAASSPTRVEYAPSGDDFNSTASYHQVADISGEVEPDLSGSALVTEQTSGKEHLELRLFNGTTYGSAHTVPGPGLTGPAWWTVDQAGDTTHVLVSAATANPTYELIDYSTTNGTHWTTRALGNAIQDSFSAGLDKDGSGLVLGVGTSKAKGYPILAAQSATFSLKKSSVKKGHKTTGSGKGSAKAKGRKVELQIEKSGKWDNVASTHESSSGAYKFSIKGSKVGKFDYRVEISDHAGYVEYAYSSARKLTVKS